MLSSVRMAQIGFIEEQSQSHRIEYQGRHVILIDSIDQISKASVLKIVFVVFVKIPVNGKW